MTTAQPASPGQPTGQPSQPRGAGTSPSVGASPSASPTRSASASPSTTRSASAAGLLAAGCVAWSAIPLTAGGVGTAMLAAAIACAVLSAARLALGPAPAEAPVFLNPVERAARSLADLARVLPWAEGMVVAVLVLEVLHRSRPWHTGLLGVALLAYLFATHLAETRARPAVLRPQAPLIAAGLGLLALSVGAAMLPAGTGSTADLIAVLAALAAIVVGALALPL
jgi:hypothetical protein